MVLTRSEQMARIHGRDTSPELLLRSAIWRAGLRYRVHLETIAGRPDVVFPRDRVAVFVDGCFFHGCPDHYVRPRTGEAFWAAKLAANVARDRRQTLELEAAGWRVCRIWEHEVFTELDSCVRLIASARADRAWQPGRAIRVVRVDDHPKGHGMERRYTEDLRDAVRCRIIVQPRSTRKWPRRVP